jgi:hypothetical protein
MHVTRPAAVELRAQACKLPGRRLPIWLCVAAAPLVSFGVLENRAQNPPGGGTLRTDRIDQPTPINQPPDVNSQLRVRAKRTRQQNFDAANTVRIRQIVADTGNLLILVENLQAQIEKTGGGPLPEQLLREVEAIEMLAHDVQAKMTLTVGTD